jgi:shikimate dehydrogenase
MGAVNCVVRRGDQLIGENTDGKGFVQSLKALTDPRGKKVVIFGAGGAARAIGVEMALAGATSFTIVNRGEERGNELTRLMTEKVKTNARLVISKSDFKVPDTPDPHWQVVDASGTTFLLQEKVKKTIVIITIINLNQIILVIW